jgi:UDP-N-acetylglucosamine--N-acetylmuramyl-(pentapeptide) pyrophosphoryl-undecaprenol N-acetylglucosamine transferase
MKSASKRILIATGGTGGHVFPAQALAEQLKKQDPDYEILFMGKGLETNKYFQRDLFASRSIDSATPFRKGVLQKAFSLLQIIKGSWQAFCWLREFQPSMVVGFGSFHSFPVLLAAVLRRVPIALFESNSIPGKVNRIFSRCALFTGVQFAGAKKWMKGPCIEVAMPLWRQEKEVSKEEARSYFSLEKDLFTYLVFGGSQGAVSINQTIAESLQAFHQEVEKIQVIHITGSESSAEEMRAFYQKKGIKACIKPFEEKMLFAWSSADLAICRAGASTLAELMNFEVPAILIPYPTASDEHQLKNAQFLQEEVKGAFCLEEKDLTAAKLLLCLKDSDLCLMKQSIQDFKKARPMEELKDLITRWLSK